MIQTQLDVKANEENNFFSLAETSISSAKLCDRLLSLVQGQNHAVAAFSNALFNKNLYCGIEGTERSKPGCILLFAGPPGVGKTYIAEISAKFLKLPYMRLDMSAFSDKEVGLVHLTGLDKSYKNAKKGVLTTFVDENPECVLLFDEIEKAHINVIHLFLQILDAGTLRDLFTQKDVSFRNTIIIFTTNAGQNLYKDNGSDYTSYLSESVIINALQTDINPNTNAPYFPAAICSRLSAGNVIMFNHLKTNHLLSIIENVLQEFAKGFYRQYHVTLEFSKDIPYALLYRYSSSSDARNITEKTKSFLADEIHKLLHLWYDIQLENATKFLSKITFSLSKSQMEAETEELFKQNSSAEILVISDKHEFDQLFENDIKAKLFNANNKEEAFELIATHDFLCIIIDPSANLPDNTEDTVRALHSTHVLFNLPPLGSSLFKRGNAVFRDIRRRFPEIPIYLLETEKITLGKDLMMSYIMEGAMGKLSLVETRPLNTVLEQIISAINIQEKINEMAARKKMLYFESVPAISEDRKTIDIELRNLSVKQNISAGDIHAISNISEHKSIALNDVIGADDVKNEMLQMLDFIRNPKKWRATGLPLPKGILLYGPPGTGKTMLARALAAEADVPFLPETASNFVKKYVGTGPESVRRLFERAREYAPSIIFIDEIDAIGRKRTGVNSNHEYEMALNALLTEMDGFHNNRKRPVLVVAATNYGGNNMELDAALLRRFDRRIFMDLPNTDERFEFIHRAVMSLSSQISNKDIERIAKRSNGMSLAKLESVVALAVRNSVKLGIRFGITLLEEALEIECHGKETRNSDLHRTALHEAGHALTSVCFNNKPLYITIVSRDGNLGYVQNDAPETCVQTRTECIEQICILLAGRAAETLFCHDGLSSNAANDLQEATNIALRLICNYGMDESFGMAVIGSGNVFSGPFAEKIHSRVYDLLNECFGVTKNLIIEHKDSFDLLVEQLMEKRRLNTEDINQIFKNTKSHPVNI